MKGYKSYIETVVRSFIKASLSEKDANPYGIPRGVFAALPTKYKNIIDFIHDFEPAREVKLSVSSISRLKDRCTISRAVPRTKENEAFIDYVKANIKKCESDRFFREYSDIAVKSRIKARQSK